MDFGIIFFGGGKDRMDFNGLVPELSVVEIDKTRYFYTEILKFKLEYERPEDKFIFLSYGNAQIMFEEIHESGWNTAKLEYPLGRGINFQIDTDEVHEIKLRLEKAGIPLFKDIKVNDYSAGNEIYTESELLVQDPDGYLLRFSQVI